MCAVDILYMMQSTYCTCVQSMYCTWCTCDFNMTILGTGLGWVWPTFIVIVWGGGGGVVTIEYG